MRLTDMHDYIHKIGKQEEFIVWQENNIQYHNNLWEKLYNM